MHEVLVTITLRLKVCFARVAMKMIKFCLICLVTLMPSILPASIDVNGLGSQKYWFILSNEINKEFQLKVNQASLTEVLAVIANKTGVRINYSALPSGLMNANCSGSTVKQILECFLVGKADLVFRYSDSVSENDLPLKLEEVWIVGEKSGESRVNVIMPSVITDNKNEISEPDQTAALLKMASSNVASERVEAMGRLLAVGKKGDVAVKQVLIAGLADPEPLVRVRALSSLAHREGAEAASALNEALHDSNVSVRLTAVDNAGNDEVLLQQALRDSDANVRQLAELRLKQLSKVGVQ